MSQRRSSPVLESGGNLLCSYDLRGQLIEVYDDLQRMLGYSRQEILGANLREFLQPESWELTRESILGQAGGASPESRTIHLRHKSGELASLEMVNRLVFEHGSPVAVQSFGTDPGSSGPSFLRQTQDLLSTTTSELARFTRDLKQLHRLSTTNYRSLADVFSDFLKTGCDIFRLNLGFVLIADDDTGVLDSVVGTSEIFRPHARLSLTRTHFASVSNRVCTRVFGFPVESGTVYPELAVCIATPIFLGSDLYGTLAFSSPVGRPLRRFSAQEMELIELMARGLGCFILEEQVQAERKSEEALVRSRNGVLERVVENRPLPETLSALALLVEGQCRGYLCAFLLLEEDVPLPPAAPSLPAGLVSELRKRWLRIAPPSLSLLNGHSPNSNFKFTTRYGLTCSSVFPIRSGAGKQIGALVLLQREPAARESPDPEVLKLASRMASIAIEQKQLTDRLEHQAQHDFLTGLPNRFRLLELLEHLLAGPDLHPLAVLFIDLDRFKQINDTLGHATGDRLLIEVAERLKSGLSGGIAARMGGDEFAVVLPGLENEESALRASRQFLDLLRAPYHLDGRELFVTASIGVSLYPKHGENASTLLRAADSAMYLAKNDGKNAVECFVADAHVGAIERLDLENSLRRALEKDEFELYFQPIVSIQGNLNGLEVLLAWHHSKLGRISPSQFIPMAEETGLIIPIGSWVLQEACRQGARWLAGGLPVQGISVNVSARQFARPNFVETVAFALTSTGFPARLLELELTESLVLNDIGGSIHRMTQLKDLGVNMTIDDFGTGYSSLNYLRRLPVTGLKIDQSFLRDLKHASGTLTVVQTIVSLAHNMHLYVVAEGVETIEELELLRTAGCDRVQGHLYGTSLRSSAAGKLLARADRRVPLAAALAAT